AVPPPLLLASFWWSPLPRLSRRRYPSPSSLPLPTIPSALFWSGLLLLCSISLAGLAKSSNRSVVSERCGKAIAFLHRARLAGRCRWIWFEEVVGDALPKRDLLPAVWGTLVQENGGRSGERLGRFASTWTCVGQVKSFCSILWWYCSNYCCLNFANIITVMYI
uniref:Uncharacterized protein n=1 Tax=Aegilops tauschii subsp. strangulata TaxID=200361 RepID=A0A453FEC6_AEGTS